MSLSYELLEFTRIGSRKRSSAKAAEIQRSSIGSKKKSLKQENTSKTHRKKRTNWKGLGSSKQGKQTSQPLAIHTKSYKSTASRTKSKLKHLQRIQLTMNLTKSTYSDDRAAYVPELVRQVQYFFDNAT